MHGSSTSITFKNAFWIVSGLWNGHDSFVRPSRDAISGFMSTDNSNTDARTWHSSALPYVEICARSTGGLSDRGLTQVVRGILVRSILPLYLLLHHVLILFGGVDASHHLALVQDFVLNECCLLRHDRDRLFLGLDGCLEVFRLLVKLQEARVHIVTVGCPFNTLLYCSTSTFPEAFRCSVVRDNTTPKQCEDTKNRNHTGDTTVRDQPISYPDAQCMP